MPSGSSAPSPSATRRSSVVNSSLRMKAVSASASGARTAVSASGTSTGTCVSRITSAFDSRAWSAKVMRLSRRLSCLISEARSSSVSRSPYSLMRSAAVLTPIPGTPGTLSEESPISACTSTTLDGGTPKRSITSASLDPLVLHRVVHDHARAGRAASDPCRRRRWSPRRRLRPPRAHRSRSDRRPRSLPSRCRRR